jgi:DNA replication protein DnaC
VQLDFSTFSDPKLTEMAQKADAYCRDLFHASNPRWLSFLGDVGTGKTHLARRISRYFRAQLDGNLIPGQDPAKRQYRMRGGFISWRVVAGALRNGDFSVLRDLEDDYFVVLDDIGSEYMSMSDFVTSKLDQLLDARLGKWTVITANLSLEQIGKFLDMRIASRLLRGGSEVIDLKDVPDFSLR